MGTHLLDDYFFRIARGKDPNLKSVYKFGRNASVGVDEVVVWSGGNGYTFPATADTVTITSDNVNDVPAGTGARSVHIYGLDENWEEADEIIALGGTSTHTYLRVFRMHVEETGTPNVVGIGNNLGNITATHNAGDTAIAYINQHLGQTLMALYTIPAGWTGYMIGANSTSSEGKSVVTNLKTRDNTKANAPWRTRGIRDSFQNQVGAEFKIQNKYTEKTDISFTAKSSASGTSVSSAFLLMLVKN